MMMIKFSGTKDLEIELIQSDNSVRLTSRYATPYEAAIAYADIRTAARAGTLRLIFNLGEILEDG